MEEPECTGPKHQYVLESRDKSYDAGTFTEEFQCHICGIIRIELWKFVREYFYNEGEE